MLTIVGELHRQAGELARALASWQRALEALDGCFWLMVSKGKSQQVKALASDIREKAQFNAEKSEMCPWILELPAAVSEAALLRDYWRMAA